MFMVTRFRGNIMRLQLYLLIWAQTVNALMDKLTDLGQNVNINCDLDGNEVYWILLKLPDPPVIILRTTTHKPFYYNKKYKQKYFIQSKNQLFINNVTLDELGVYYCMNTDTTSKTFSNVTRLHINDPIPESQNKTVELHCGQTLTQCHIVSIISGVFNAVLLIVVIGLMKVFVFGSKTISKTPKTQDNLQQPEDSGQYAEVTFTTRCKPTQINSTYALVQLPTSQTCNNK
ncbi:uncharacterized protein [Paramisgurnus dabryanus]|uniref:uncharacterized protein isoform X2 n=1 Tax=Paramisgurnus dabryanus TaxID=90735 RepID=UPI0031F4154A